MGDIGVQAEREGAAVPRIPLPSGFLSAGCPVVGFLRSISGLNHDAVTACVDLLFLFTVAIWWRQGGGDGGAMMMMGESVSLL